jgi:hypothetical protein
VQAEVTYLAPPACFLMNATVSPSAMASAHRTRHRERIGGPAGGSPESSWWGPSSGRNRLALGRASSRGCEPVHRAVGTGPAADPSRGVENFWSVRPPAGDQLLF